MQDNKEKLAIGLKKASSLLNKVVQMTENGDYCINIMQQNLAVIGLLKAAHQNLMEKHLNTCFRHAMAKNDSKIQEEMIIEILKVTKLSNK